MWQACLPVKDLDLGYNLVTTHDGKGAFVIVDHDEQEAQAAAAPMGFVYSAGEHQYFSTKMFFNCRYSVVLLLVCPCYDPLLVLSNQHNNTRLAKQGRCPQSTLIVLFGCWCASAMTCYGLCICLAKQGRCPQSTLIVPTARWLQKLGADIQM